MKRFVITLLVACFSMAAFAHEGEEHGTEKKAATTAPDYFSSEALSDKYEVLIKYGELEGGKESMLRLFLSDAATNRAIDSASISIKVLNHPDLKLELDRIDTGVYLIKGIFQATRTMTCRSMSMATWVPTCCNCRRLL